MSYRKRNDKMEKVESIEALKSNKVKIQKPTKDERRALRDKTKAILRTHNTMSDEIVESLEFRIACLVAKAEKNREKTAPFEGFMATCRLIINDVSKLRKCELSCNGNVEISEGLLRKIEDLPKFFPTLTEKE